ncbi:hypothetical protein EUX98_g2641 [Antrodiella citrinella]|uniref:Cytokinin riboside 5'-monophosphate phosphoribohydrolase n=1 Tax=Antrodiella citrinella TaxID=2447956 RepID=A0A4S4N6T1_9APHY|nr:hypothetical protein EUX98_g2641 [Antrodiella citrinella]
MGLCFSFSSHKTTHIQHISTPIPCSVSAQRQSYSDGNMAVTQGEEPTTAVAVYCASSLGKEKAFQNAASSLGTALGQAGRPLVYGGGSKGLMGVVSGAALAEGGHVTGVVPFAMVAAGGEKEQTKNANAPPGYGRVILAEAGREAVQTVVVDSMHERKMEMAKRSCAFVGLPGGYGTFEEILEVVTWSQLGIHAKPIILINVHSFYEPLRALIQTSIRAGFITPNNINLISFVDGPGPDDHAAHEDYDWGIAALEALETWEHAVKEYSYDWTKRRDGEGEAVEVT